MKRRSFFLTLSFVVLALFVGKAELVAIGDANQAAGQRLTTDTEWGHPAGFMFTACPVGFRPSVGFTVENKEPISASLYNCVVGEPTS